MADHLQLPGSSAQIATEDINGIHYQRTKLIDGTAGSTTALPLSGDKTFGLDVDVTRVSELENNNNLLKLILQQLLIQNELLARGLNIPGGTDPYNQDSFYTIR